MTYEIRDEIIEEFEHYTQYLYTLTIETEDGNEIEAGWAYVAEATEEGLEHGNLYSVEITNLDVDEEYRNHGLGTKIIKRIVNDLGVAAITPCNADNERLYARLGRKIDDRGLQGGTGVYSIAL